MAGAEVFLPEIPLFPLALGTLDSAEHAAARGSLPEEDEASRAVLIAALTVGLLRLSWLAFSSLRTARRQSGRSPVIAADATGALVQRERGPPQLLVTAPAWRCPPQGPSGVATLCLLAAAGLFGHELLALGVAGPELTAGALASGGWGALGLAGVGEVFMPGGLRFALEAIAIELTASTAPPEQVPKRLRWVTAGMGWASVVLILGRLGALGLTLQQPFAGLWAAGRAALAASLLLYAGGSSARGDARRRDEEDRRSAGVLRLLAHPRSRQCFRLGEDALASRLWGLRRGYACSLVALLGLGVAAAYTPYLLAGERTLFRRAAELIPYTILSFFGLDFDGLRLVLSWGTVGAVLGSPILILLHHVSALPGDLQSARERFGGFEAALLLQLEARAGSRQISSDGLAEGPGSDLATLLPPGAVGVVDERVAPSDDAFFRDLEAVAHRECLRWGKEARASLREQGRERLDVLLQALDRSARTAGSVIMSAGTAIGLLLGGFGSAFLALPLVALQESLGGAWAAVRRSGGRATSPAGSSASSSSTPSSSS